MNRFARITGVLLQLQARRVVRGQELAARFGVSLRTVYRDLRTLEEAGVPICGEVGVGFSLAEGYRLPPVMLTRDEATALLTAESLALQLTDEPTARLSRAAMDKLRAVLRFADRDHLADLSPRVAVAPPPGPAELARSAWYQPLLAAVAARRVVRLTYCARAADAAGERLVEPIGLYWRRCWYLVAFCRVRQAFREFRFDRISHLAESGEVFAPRPDTLASHFAAQAARLQQVELIQVRLAPDAARALQDHKYSFGWVSEQPGPGGTVDMALLPGDLTYVARCLLPYAGSFTVLSPAALVIELQALAHAAHAAFGVLPT